jgi:hypothetical protein
MFNTARIASHAIASDTAIPVPRHSLGASANSASPATKASRCATLDTETASPGVLGSATGSPADRGVVLAVSACSRRSRRGRLCGAADGIA